jgi:hypothetical protein
MPDPPAHKSASLKRLRNIDRLAIEFLPRDHVIITCMKMMMLKDLPNYRPLPKRRSSSRMPNSIIVGRPSAAQ